jgi:hypothetical protein
MNDMKLYQNTEKVNTITNHTAGRCGSWYSSS